MALAGVDGSNIWSNAHNPKVAGSNPAPATNGAKAQVRGPFRGIGEGLDRSLGALRVGVAVVLESRVVPTQRRIARRAGNFGLAARRGRGTFGAFSVAKPVLTCGNAASRPRARAPGVYPLSNHFSNHSAVTDCS
jgi:hypothetical protein